MEFSDNQDVNYIHDGTDTRGATIKMRGTGRKSMVTHRKPIARTQGGNTSSASSSKFTSNATEENATGRVSGNTRSKMPRDETIDENVSRGNVDEQSNSDQDNNAKATNAKESYRANRSDALSHIVAGIALAVALYTQFISIPKLKQGTPLQIDSGHCPQVLESMEDFRKRLDSVESSIQDCMARIKGFEESFKKKLKAVAYKDDIANLVQKTNFEDRLREIEQNFSDQVSAKVEENKSLQNQFLKLKDDVSMLFEGNSGIKNEQEELKTNVMTLEDQLGKQSRYVEKKTVEVEKEMSQHKKAVRDLNVSLENLESNIKYLTENVTGVSIETLVLDKRTEDKSLQNQFLKLEDEISMQSKGISGIKAEQEELKTNVMTLEDQLGKQSQYLEKKTAEVEKEMSQHKEAVGGLNESLENLESNMKLLTDNVTGISIETFALDKRTEDIKKNIFHKVSLIVVIMMDTVLIVVIIIYLAAKRDNNRRLNWNVDIEEQEVNGGVNNSPAPYSTGGRILSQVRANTRLENKICVISFYEETHPLHMRMTLSVTEQLTIQPVEFIIRRHDDILNIPPVVLFFLFVDFNERNVILEDPTLELGDLRLTTVQTVQKMGGKIVIFYVRDQMSKQLDSTKLYNEDLVSVTRQRELSDLNRRSCFISAYDQLTDFQKTHLIRIVGNELTGR